MSTNIGSAEMELGLYDELTPDERMDAWHALMRKAGLNPDTTIMMPYDAGPFHVGMNFLDMDSATPKGPTEEPRNEH